MKGQSVFGVTPMRRRRCGFESRAGRQRKEVPMVRAVKTLGVGRNIRSVALRR